MKLRWQVENYSSLKDFPPAQDKGLGRPALESPQKSRNGSSYPNRNGRQALSARAQHSPISSQRRTFGEFVPRHARSLGRVKSVFGAIAARVRYTICKSRRPPGRGSGESTGLIHRQFLRRQVNSQPYSLAIAFCTRGAWGCRDACCRGALFPACGCFTLNRPSVPGGECFSLSQLTRPDHGRTSTPFCKRTVGTCRPRKPIWR